MTGYTDFAYNKNIINNSLNDFHDNSLKNAFQNKKSVLATGYAKLLQDLVIKTRFYLVPKRTALPKNIVIFLL